MAWFKSPDVNSQSAPGGPEEFRDKTCKNPYKNRHDTEARNYQRYIHRAPPNANHWKLILY